MFYRTQIKSVTGSVVVDKDGKNLQFMGYLPVKAGDWVFTDGKFIFGNVPPRGSPAVFAEVQSGIPVLADDLRGYFAKNGSFRNYAVAQDDWIVNSDKKFAHGADNFNDAKIIDADFSERGEKLVATDGIYQDSHTLDTNSVKIVVNDTSTFSSLHFSYVSTYYPMVYEQILGSDYFPAEQKKIKLYTNDKKDSEIDLEPFAKDVEQRAILAANEIMKHSYTEQELQNNDLKTFEMSGIAAGQLITYTYTYGTLESLTKYARSSWDIDNDPTFVNKPAESPPNEPFIAYSTAYVLSGSISENGFGGLIFAATYGYCFPRIQPRFKESYGFYHTFCWIYEWKCVPFGFSAIYHVSPDNETLTPVSFRDFGGIKSDIGLYDDMSTLDFVISGSHFGKVADLFMTRHIELLSGLVPEELDEEIFFPVGDGFYQIDKFGRLTFYNSDKEKVAENIPVHDDFFHIEIEHGVFSPDRFILNFAEKPYLRCKVYTSDGNIENKVMVIGNSSGANFLDEEGNVMEKIYVEQGNPQNILEPSTGYYTIPPMDGYYIKYPTGICEPLQFTPLFYQFQKGSYLYGVKGGKLYLKPKDGKAELIGDGVKNFRLQELKKISKAKR